jgi:hypothetical protein
VSVDSTAIVYEPDVVKVSNEFDARFWEPLVGPVQVTTGLEDDACIILTL